MRRAAAAIGLTLTVMGTGGALAAASPPSASFGVFPQEPVSGQPVRLVSYSCDPDGRLARQLWDLDDDGAFDDASGANVSASFSAGRHRVRLQVSNRQGATATRQQTIDVGASSAAYVDPVEFDPPLLSPFPVVRLSGSVTGALTRISVLSVRAPVCSRATVLCTGERCPFRRSTKLTGRGATRFPGLQRRILAGSTVKVIVTRRDRIGKLTRFRFRAGRSPKRLDRCVRYGATRGIRCPRN